MAIDEKKLKPCPFCGSDIRIICTDDEGNLHDEDYERNPWSGLGYKLYHDITDVEDENCPIARHEGEGEMGVWIYDTKEEAIEAWNKRISDKDVPDTNDGKWIPCSKELPKESGKYLVTLKGGDVETDSFSKVDNKWVYFNTQIAWFSRELPEPYKGEE